MNSDAAQLDILYIKPISGDICGPHRTQLLYYRNVHPSYTIKIEVDHHWVYEGKEIHEKQEYVLKPNPNADPNVVSVLDQLMGCPIPGPTMQIFYWDVKRAVRV